MYIASVQAYLFTFLVRCRWLKVLAKVADYALTSQLQQQLHGSAELIDHITCPNQAVELICGTSELYHQQFAHVSVLGKLKKSKIAEAEEYRQLDGWCFNNALDGIYLLVEGDAGSHADGNEMTKLINERQRIKILCLVSHEEGEYNWVELSAVDYIVTKRIGARYSHWQSLKQSDEFGLIPKWVDSLTATSCTLVQMKLPLVDHDLLNPFILVRPAAAELCLYSLEFKSLATPGGYMHDMMCLWMMGILAMELGLTEAGGAMGHVNRSPSSASL
jgi:hypothetical protein